MRPRAHCHGTDLEATEKIFVCEDLYQGTDLQVAEKVLVCDREMS